MSLTFLMFTSDIFFSTMSNEGCFTLITSIVYEYQLNKSIFIEIMKIAGVCKDTNEQKSFRL